MSSDPASAETSYIVLGLLERIEPATPYDLKQLAQVSTVNFWTVPHTQIYTRVRAPRRGGAAQQNAASRRDAGGGSTR